jgi:predicted nucleic acid-binding protein
MQALLVDANMITEYLKSDKEAILADILGEYKLCISAVTYTELLASKVAHEAEYQSKITDLIAQNFELIPVNAEIAMQAAELLRTVETTLAHAYIAATAINKDIPLLTYDFKVFDQVPNLKLVDL